MTLHSQQRAISVKYLIRTLGQKLHKQQMKMWCSRCVYVCGSWVCVSMEGEACVLV